MPLQAGTRPPVVVLTGGIASGKSAVAERLEGLGAPLIDTDVLAREAVASGTPGLRAVVDAFGAEIANADGSLNRRRLRELVFSDADARCQLEEILHPLIETAARSRINELNEAAYCVLVVPLLVETGLFPDADVVVVVDVPEREQIARLCRRDGLDEASAQRMLDVQASREQRLQHADEVIKNTGSLATLDQQVTELHQRLLARFS